jgi:hypothetical protein
MHRTGANPFHLRPAACEWLVKPWAKAVKSRDFPRYQPFGAFLNKTEKAQQPHSCFPLTKFKKALKIQRLSFWKTM